MEKIFRKSVEFCSESDIWKLNVAHVLFMQENKFKVSRTKTIREAAKKVPSLVVRP